MVFYGLMGYIVMGCLLLSFGGSMGNENIQCCSKHSRVFFSYVPLYLFDFFSVSAFRVNGCFASV